MITAFGGPPKESIEMAALILSSSSPPHRSSLDKLWQGGRKPAIDFDGIKAGKLAGDMRKRRLARSRRAADQQDLRGGGGRTGFSGQAAVAGKSLPLALQ